MKNIIFSINGGLGKHIAATAVCEAIKSNFPESRLFVLAAYPDPFLNNPFVYRVYRHGYTPYFYEDVIQDNDVSMFLHDPYDCPEYILNDIHLIEAWCKIHNIKYSGEQPRLYLADAEILNLQSQLSLSKPLLVFHPFGGPDNQTFSYNWNRDLSFPVAQTLVNALHTKYDIIQIRNQNQPHLKHAGSLDTSIRSLFCVLTLSHQRLLIDSFSQHAAAALNMSSTVCWITNTPKKIGYSIHRNISANISDNEKNIHTVDSVLDKYDFSGNRQWQCPYTSVEDIFNIDEILAAF